MIDMDLLFHNREIMDVLDKETPFSYNLYRAIVCRMEQNESEELPYHYIRRGGQVLSVDKNKDAYRMFYLDYIPCGRGWNANYMTGPTDYSCYYNCRDYFDYDSRFMGYVSDLYLGILMEGDEDNFTECLSGSDEGCVDYVEVIGAISIEDGLCDEIGNRYEPESGELSAGRIARLLILSCAYVHAFINSSTIPAQWEEELNSSYDMLKKAEKHHGEWMNLEEDEDGCMYLHSFLDTMAEMLTDNKDSYPVLIPLLLDVHFSMRQNCGGSGISLYFFSSREMAEYRHLRECYPESPYIERMDKLLTYLEDPADKKEVAEEGTYEAYEDFISMHCGYVGDEYVCAYLFYEDKVCMPKAFPLIAAYFDGLLEEFKKEVEKYEKTRERESGGNVA